MGCERFFRRKTIPKSRTNSGRVNNESNVPVVKTRTIGDPVFVPAGVNNIALEGLVEKRLVEKRLVEKRSVRLPSRTMCTLLAKEPVFDQYVTSYGGGRTGGGGTSEEAIARGKRKFKRSKRQISRLRLR